MKHVSWFTYVCIALAVVAIFLGLPDLGNISHNVRIFIQFPILLLMVFVSTSNYILQLKDAVPERTTWFWLMLASIFTLTGDAFFVYGNIKASMTVITISSGLMFFAYACFIIGLLVMGRHIRAQENKIIFWIPAIIILLGFIAAGFLMFRTFQASNLDNVLRITFLVYLVADFFLIVSNLLVVIRTMGGKLSLTYLIIGIGCCMLVAYQMSSLFMMSSGIDIYTNKIQLVFVAALAILTAGVDMRFCIQKEMSQMESK
ncbi:MAG: hypothetical protein HGA95_04305 [Caldiserica bacterium]|nr:hypothetical protein [Caldisericota bacterium]